MGWHAVIACVHSADHRDMHFQGMAPEQEGAGKFEDRLTANCAMRLFGKT